MKQRTCFSRLSGNATLNHINSPLDDFRMISGKGRWFLISSIKDFHTKTEGGIKAAVGKLLFSVTPRDNPGFEKKIISSFLSRFPSKSITPCLYGSALVISLQNFIRKWSKQIGLLLSVVFSAGFLDKVNMLRLASLAAASSLWNLYTWAISKEESHGATAEEIIQGSEVRSKWHCQETETTLNTCGLWQEEVSAQVSWYLRAARSQGHGRLAGSTRGTRQVQNQVQTNYLPQTASDRVTSIAGGSPLTPEKGFVTTVLHICSKTDIRTNTWGNRFTATLQHFLTEKYNWSHLFSC